MFIPFLEEIRDKTPLAGARSHTRTRPDTHARTGSQGPGWGGAGYRGALGAGAGWRLNRARPAATWPPLATASGLRAREAHPGLRGYPDPRHVHVAVQKVQLGLQGQDQAGERGARVRRPPPRLRARGQAAGAGGGAGGGGARGGGARGGGLLGQPGVVVVVFPPLPVLPGVHRKVQGQQLVLRVRQGDHGWNRGERRRASRPRGSPQGGQQRGSTGRCLRGSVEQWRPPRHTGASRGVEITGL